MAAVNKNNTSLMDLDGGTRETTCLVDERVRCQATSRVGRGKRERELTAHSHQRSRVTVGAATRSKKKSRKKSKQQGSNAERSTAAHNKRAHQHATLNSKFDLEHAPAVVSLPTTLVAGGWWSEVRVVHLGDGEVVGRVGGWTQVGG